MSLAQPLAPPLSRPRGAQPFARSETREYIYEVSDGGRTLRGELRNERGASDLSALWLGTSQVESTGVPLGESSRGRVYASPNCADKPTFPGFPSPLARLQSRTPELAKGPRTQQVTTESEAQRASAAAPTPATRLQHARTRRRATTPAPARWMPASPSAPLAGERQPEHACESEM